MSVKRTGIIDELLREKINELMTFALTTPSEKADVFVDWTPHVNWIEIRACYGGWIGHFKDFSRCINLPRSDDPEHATVESAIEAIDNAINEIKEAIK